MNDDSHSNPGDSCQWESSSEDDAAKGQVNWMLDLVHLTPSASFMG